MRLACTCLLMLAASFVHAQPCTSGLSGTYTVGPSGSYPTLTAAITALRNNGATAPVVFEFNSNYTGTSETYPVSFANLACLTASNTLTVRPQAGTANVLMTTAVAGPVLSLTNARYVILDGRPGGTGSSRQWTIRNTVSTGNALLFTNDGSYNEVRFLNIESPNNSPTNGIVCFGSSTLSVTNGNSFNTISDCHIGSLGTPPLNGIYSVGSAGKKNTGNKILNCNIFNFRSTVAIASGVYLGANSTDWEVKGNSLYHPVQIPAGSHTTIGIYVRDTTSANFSIENNFIGGSAPQCGGSKPIVSGDYRGIVMATSRTNYSSVQNNTIANVDWRNYGSTELFAGIHIGYGKVNCGGITGNTVGSTTQYGNILSTSKYLTQPTVTGILVYQFFDLGLFVIDTVLIRNNRVAGFVSGPDATNYLGTDLIGIEVRGQTNGFVEIFGNTIGSTTVVGSMDNNNTTATYYVRGIQSFVSSGSISNLISNNLVVHLRGQATGIYIQGGSTKVLNNTLRSIHGESGQGNLAGLQGIFITGADANTEISGNVIHSFATKSTNGQAGIGGIDFQSLQGQAIISRNLIHSFQTQYQYAPLRGIKAFTSQNGGLTITNNMIRLGIDSVGNTLTAGNALTGIETELDNSLITHNSIHLTSNGIVDATCLKIGEKAANPSRITNNIFSNMRIATASQRSTGITVSDLVSFNFTGLTIRNNLYQIPNAAGSFIGGFNNQYYATLPAWQTATGMETSSLNTNPGFINSNGNASNVNLHLGNSSPAESAGVAEPGIVNDFDNEVRANLTPVDIGADAGNFTCAAPATPTIAATPGASVCAGTTVTLTATVPGCTGCSFTWNGTPGTASLAVNTPGVYTVVASNGCATSTAQQVVTMQPVITPTLSFSTSGCPGNTLTFTATTNITTGATITWYVNNAAVATGSSYILNNATNGMQVYANLSATGCVNPTTVTTAVTTLGCIATALVPVNGVESVWIAPNPTHGHLVIDIKLQTAKRVGFIVKDGVGRVICQLPPVLMYGAVKKEIDLREFVAGVYYLAIMVDGKVMVTKILKQ